MTALPSCENRRPRPKQVAACFFLCLTIWFRTDQIQVLERVSVATLKSKLSQYLEAVKNGKEIIVTSHHHPVARLLPLEKSPETVAVATSALRPISSLRKIKGTRLKVDPVEYLLEDRRGRCIALAEVCNLGPGTVGHVAS